MTIEELANQTGMDLFPAERELSSVSLVHGGSTMSGLIAGATPDTLLVTALCNNQLVRVAELMDVPGLCFASPARPDAGLRELARQRGVAILVSAWDLEETTCRLQRCLQRQGAVPR